MKAQIGQRVQLTRKQSVDHFKVADMPITGSLAGYREKAYNERHWLIRFDDNREAWYARWEFGIITGKGLK